MPEIAEFDRTWRTSSTFRASLKQLVQLPPAVLAELGNALSAATGDELPEALSDPELAPALAAHRTLYTYARDYGADAVVARMIELVVASDPALAIEPEAQKLIAASLAFNSSTERAIALDDAEYAFMARVARVQAYLDLRVVSPPSDNDGADIGDRSELLPIPLIRFTFDEPVGGDESITVQVPWDQLATLLEQIPAILSQRASLLKKLPESLTKPSAWYEDPPP